MKTDFKRENMQKLFEVMKMSEEQRKRMEALLKKQFDKADGKDDSKGSDISIPEPDNEIMGELNKLSQPKNE